MYYTRLLRNLNVIMYNAPSRPDAGQFGFLLLLRLLDLASGPKQGAMASPHTELMMYVRYTNRILH